MTQKHRAQEALLQDTAACERNNGPHDMTHPFDLSGRVALVTGANTGLGQAIALALAGAGADIVALGRSAPTETQAQVAALDRRFAWIEAALDEITPISTAVDAAASAFGTLDILVNNAGTIRRNDAL